MQLKIPNVLTKAEVAECRGLLEKSDWTEGQKTAGGLARLVKNNAQVRVDQPAARRLSNMILERLTKSPLFMAAALPHKFVPPMFNRYEVGQYYGSHVDSAVQRAEGSAEQVRTDLSATLFLSNIDEYDGGELVIEDTFGVRSIKLAAGDMILYPGTSVHQVAPVTRGARMAAVFWVQSMVRDDGDRTLLLQLSAAIQQIKAAKPEDLTTALQLANVYENLLRRWSET